MSANLAASVRARLLHVAKAQSADFNQVLVRFALERILYRLSQSAHADHFLLKGALLFTLWYDMPHRTTRDADLLGFGPSDLESIAQTFRDIASVAAVRGFGARHRNWLGGWDRCRACVSTGRSAFYRIGSASATPCRAALARQRLLRNPSAGSPAGSKPQNRHRHA